MEQRDERIVDDLDNHLGCDKRSWGGNIIVFKEGAGENLEQLYVDLLILCIAWLRQFALSRIDSTNIRYISVCEHCVQIFSTRNVGRDLIYKKMKKNG
jgi:hypothetical protein